MATVPRVGVGSTVTRRMPYVQVDQLPPMRRVMRRPRHNFHIKHRPWEIAPFMLAPVLPGETLKNLLMQARVLTDPIRSQLIGWWCEHYFFYVPHRAMALLGSAQQVSPSTGLTRLEIQSMHLDPEYDLLGKTTHQSTNMYHLYHKGATATGVPWAWLALDAIVAHYFRDEGEAIADGSVTSFATVDAGGLPLAMAVPHRSNFMDSMLNDANYAVHDVTVDVDATPTPDTVSMSEIDQAMRTYQWLRMNNLVEMTFEQFLETHGVRVPDALEEFTPELLRYHREWTYPANSADPDAGTVRSVCSWSPTLRADKDRYFKEPGFIVGCAVARPKVYLANQPVAAAAAFSKAVDWLPAMLAGEAWASFRHYAQGSGPLPALTDAGGYWLDVKDLFLYGDQFINFDYASATDMNLVSLPSTGGQKRYPILADAKGLFVDSVADVATRVRQDGAVSLGIASRQSDMLRSTAAAS